MKNLSVITIGYNSADVLSRTIESVLGQTVSPYEYIIIDGASSDGSVKIAESYKDKFSKKGVSYKIISEPDKGIYDAMNKGIKASSGDVIGLINSGDTYMPEMIETASKAYENSPYDLFYGDINLVKTSGDIIVKHSKPDSFPTSRHWNHPTMMVTKETYNELGLYKNTGIHDDFEFFLRARKAGKKIHIENKVLASFYVGGASNDKSFKKCKKRCMDRYKAYRDNGYSRLSMLECAGIEIAKFILS